MAVMAYRTRDGLADYGFSIDYQPGMGWRVYIVFRPFRQSQEDGLLLPYRAIECPFTGYPRVTDSDLDVLIEGSLQAFASSQVRGTREWTRYRRGQALLCELVREAR